MDESMDEVITNEQFLQVLQDMGIYPEYHELIMGVLDMELTLQELKRQLFVMNGCPYNELAARWFLNHTGPIESFNDIIDELDEKGIDNVYFDDKNKVAIWQDW